MAVSKLFKYLLIRVAIRFGTDATFGTKEKARSDREIYVMKLNELFERLVLLQCNARARTTNNFVKETLSYF